MYDELVAMASNAPRYEWIYNPDGDPPGEFNRTREGLANIKSKLGDRAYAYLLARVEENWARLQTGDAEDLRQLKLSFGEMAHFLRVKQYKATDISGDLVAHTAVRVPM
ncbi:MAG: hypothetical protein V4537_01820 [Pseudomonadota bacterium]